MTDQEKIELLSKALQYYADEQNWYWRTTTVGFSLKGDPLRPWIVASNAFDQIRQ